MNQSETAAERLAALVKANSKHSDYQLLHPMIRYAVGDTYQPAGKQEERRQAYMQSSLPLSGKSVLDIGANTGYFSFGAIQAGATHVTAVEGNADHAKFIAEVARCLGIEQRLHVRHSYFDFSLADAEHFDIALCLNVLHHLGDDFGDQRIVLEEAKNEMVHALRAMAKKSTWMWFQLGFNWKGNRYKPLFPNGLKSELITFVTAACEGEWSIDKIAVFNPQTGDYEDSRDNLLGRFDKIGEFLNRPLFLLRSLQES